jgi:hypothetical protein
MRCKQIARQTKGEIEEIELRGLQCSVAGICRRKGICALSPFARPELVDRELQSQAEGAQTQAPAPAGTYPTSYEVLQFKYSLGFHWVKVANFTEAIRVIGSLPDEDQPRLIRREEYFEVPV